MTSIQKIALYPPTGRNSSVLAFAKITFKLADGSLIDIDNWRILPSRRGFYVAPSSQRVQTGESVLFAPVITFGSQAFKREFQEVVLAEYERWRAMQPLSGFDALITNDDEQQPQPIPQPPQKAGLTMATAADPVDARQRPIVDRNRLTSATPASRPQSNINSGVSRG